jgi:hypothetical protein
MADLSNITQLSGISITSDQYTGANNQNATFAVASVTTAQRDKLENVTPYIVGGNTNVRVKNGTRIYNITLGMPQIFRNGGWENEVSINTTATGVGLTNGSPFVYPSGTRASVEVAGNEANGFTYYDSKNNVLRTRKNGAWETITSA